MNVGVKQEKRFLFIPKKLLNLVNYNEKALSFHLKGLFLWDGNMFIDEIKIYIKAGNGGNGAISFRREKYIQNGGPDGGHGGYGGHVIVKASTGESSLNKFYHKRHYKAENGVGGQGDKKNGRKGKNCYVIVPIGTIIYEICTSKQLTESGSEGTPTLRILADLHTEGEEVVVARGGIGGKGNSAFANSVEQAPRIAEHGALGEEKTLFLELRSIADVGLIGFPNAGKSTFLANVTNAKPKIGDYPFTTLIPNVGVRTVSPGNRFTIADIPGIIEGASEGRGLGFKFLRHIERCRLLLYLIDLDTYTPEVCIQHLQTLFQEVKDYDEDLFKRKSVVCGNKIDTENGKDNSPIVIKSVSSWTFHIIPFQPKMELL